MPELYVEPLTDRWTCFHCNKAASGKKKLFKCAGCEAITYCSRECQKEDWPRHGYNCVPVMVTEIPGKGRGLVAARDIKMGDLIFKDKQAIKLRAARVTERGVSVDSVDKEFVKSLKDQIEMLPPEAKNLFFQLRPKLDAVMGDFYPYLTRAGFSGSDVNIVRLFLDNAKKNPKENNFYALRLNLELVNHSCSPNAANEVEATDKDSELRAIRDICKGEEICICYIDNFKRFGSISRKRKTSMKKVFGFDCKCPVCLGKVPGQDKLMKKLIELHTKSDPNPSDWRKEASIRDKIVDVAHDLNIGHPSDKVDALFKLVEAAQLARDLTLVRKAMDKLKKLAEDTKLKHIQRDYEMTERGLGRTVYRLQD